METKEKKKNEQYKLFKTKIVDLLWSVQEYCTKNDINAKDEKVKFMIGWFALLNIDVVEAAIERRYKGKYGIKWTHFYGMDTTVADGVDVEYFFPNHDGMFVYDA